MTNYFVQHMGVGPFAHGDIVTLDDLGLQDGDRHLQRLIDSGALAMTDSERQVAGEDSGAPELTRGYPAGKPVTDEEIAQARAANPATGLPQDVPVEQARRATRADEKAK